VTAPSEWEGRADTLHRHLLRAAAGSPVVQRDGRDGRVWQGSREKVLWDLWPHAESRGRTHPYGGQLSRLLAADVVVTGKAGAHESLYWVALTRGEAAPPADPRQCPQCPERFDSVQARRGHQASHREGPRRLWSDADLDALADRLAPRLLAVLGRPSAVTGATQTTDHTSASGDA
jgi:hypothetical protein